ncbi:hypothetical protein H2200_010236 [Cladophialophora chaetospira]|uniref:Uncharacterized protein n=1 Tax=Cladophialophora chaetospira TaxID=386627 RepID=A0AA38X2F0_9EURO|nr:hypothetical protein H2200_010236 [Cladophialophora chaetospira]
MEPDSATEMSSFTIDQYRLLLTANAPAISPNTHAPPGARGRRNSVSTESPSTFEQPTTREGLESAFALLGLTDGEDQTQKSLKDLDTLAKAMSFTKLDHDLFLRKPNPENLFALQITLMRNSQVVTNKWSDGRLLFTVIEGLKEGKLDWCFDSSGLKLAPARSRLIKVLKKPRENEYYATFVQIKGDGDTASLVVWVDGVPLRTKRYWRTKRGKNASELLLLAGEKSSTKAGRAKLESVQQLQQYHVIDPSRTRIPPTNISFVNKQVHAEANTILYGSNKFSYIMDVVRRVNEPFMDSLRNGISPLNSSKIKKLEMTVPHSAVVGPDSHPFAGKFEWMGARPVHTEA